MTDRFINLEYAQARWLVIFSFLFGLTLDTMSIMQEATLFMPPFTALFLMYWSAQFLKHTHFISAFVLGIFLDALYQTTMGSHALILIILTFIMLRYRLLFRTHSVLQQAIVIVFYLFTYQFLAYILYSQDLNEEQLIHYWVMPFGALIAWPVIALSLRKLTQTFIAT